MSDKTRPPFEFQQQPGWEDLNIPFNIGTGRTLYSGSSQDDRLRLRFFKRTSDGHLIGYVRYGDGSDGPPGHAHGGVSAYVLDEAMGTAAWMNLYPVVAAELNFKYKLMTPLHTNIFVEAWIGHVAPRRLTIHSKLSLESGEVCVLGEGSFAILKKSKVQALLNSMPTTDRLWQTLPMKWLDDDPS